MSFAFPVLKVFQELAAAAAAAAAQLNKKLTAEKTFRINPKLNAISVSSNIIFSRDDVMSFATMWHFFFLFYLIEDQERNFKF